MKYQWVEDYYRQGTFDFFANYPDPYYSISFDLDATQVKAFAKAAGHPVYRSLCYFFARAMGRATRSQALQREDRCGLAAVPTPLPRR